LAQEASKKGGGTRQSAKQRVEDQSFKGKIRN